MSVLPIRKSWWRAAAIAIVLFGLTAVFAGEQGRKLLAARLKDPSLLLAERSPGERAAGALTQTKPARSAPTERVLSQVRSRPAAPADAGLPGAGLPGFGGAPDALGGPSGFPAGSPLSGGNSPYIGPGPQGFPGGEPAGGGIVTPGGGGGGTTPLSPPVPEPSTWLTMIVGFLAMGVLLRKRRSRSGETGRALDADRA